VSRGILVLLGSGETAPGMTKVHREVFSRLGDVRGVNLDTPYGFQENVPQMTDKLLDYFETSLHVDLQPLHFTSFADSTAVEQSIFRQSVREANYVFAGPGSPSYALKQWLPMSLQDDLRGVLQNGGAVCFSSAAALTIGRKTIPVYEMYKVGDAPFWLDGLDLVAHAGLNCVVVPHFDNQEGSNYDTSCCYIGKRRLELLESELEPGTATLGIDEHTAVLIDLEAQTIEVLGKANAYWRSGGDVLILANGTTTPLGELQSFEPESLELPTNEAPAVLTPLELAREISTTTFEASEALASLVRLAQTGGDGYIDPTDLVNRILEARIAARKAGSYEIADQLRDALVASGIDVHDGPGGSTWALRQG